ncbi:MAG: beta-lactamase family protein [Pleurocapsa sp. SU_196_0]|nr:beta-lactamase family protein [Pleurocapsa sp. SU_196_0]
MPGHRRLGSTRGNSSGAATRTPVWGMPTRPGDMISTASDLLRFGNALREGKLVSPQTLALMTAPKSEVPYGYGFQLFPGNRVGHTGGAPGQNTLFSLNLKDRVHGHRPRQPGPSRGRGNALRGRVDGVRHGSPLNL